MGDLAEVTAGPDLVTEAQGAYTVATAALEAVETALKGLDLHLSRLIGGELYEWPIDALDAALADLVNYTTTDETSLGQLADMEEKAGASPR